MPAPPHSPYLFSALQPCLACPSQHSVLTSVPAGFPPTLSTSPSTTLCSHNYPDSISVVGRTAYVQTGVIGECNRDGNRQSRLLRCTSSAFEVFTMDHDTGNLRLDMQAG